MPSSSPEAGSGRAALIRQIQERTGIDEPMIERLVRTFYGAAREDELLGPVFAAHVEDWEVHIERMCRFWSSVALMSGTYHGQPMQKHQPLPVQGEHFGRWLALFGEAARQTCPPAAADLFIDRAERIAQSLEMGIAFSRGDLNPVPRRSAGPRQAQAAAR